MINSLKYKYLNIRLITFFLFEVVISVVLIYLQQEYVIIPNMFNNSFVTDAFKSQFFDQFSKYRYLSFILGLTFLSMRIFVVSVCFYVGRIFFDEYDKMNYNDCVNVTLKSDVIMILFSSIQIALTLLLGIDSQIDIVKYFSLLFCFNIDILEPWLILPISMINVFEIVYCLFLAYLISVVCSRRYIESLSFVILTYGFMFLVYILFLIFVILYVVQ